MIRSTNNRAYWNNRVLVLHCKRKSFLSRVIRFVTKSKYSHTAIAYVVNGETLVIDAQRKGVQSQLFKEWENKWNYEFTPTLVNLIDVGTSREQFNLKLNTVLGHKYDFKSLVKQLLSERFGRKWTKEIDPTKRFYCSELAAFLLNQPDFYKMNPQDVYQRFTNPYNNY